MAFYFGAKGGSRRAKRRGCAAGPDWAILGALALSAALVSACGGDLRRMRIDHYREPCPGWGSYVCYRADEGDGYQLFYDYIKDFDYRWGKVSLLEVSANEISSPDEDEGSVTYELVRVLHEETVPPGTSFELSFEFVREWEAQAFEEQEDGGWSLFGEIAVDCATNALCDRLPDALAAGFEHTEPGGPLLVVSVESPPEEEEAEE